MYFPQNILRISTTEAIPKSDKSNDNQWRKGTELTPKSLTVQAFGCCITSLFIAWLCAFRFVYGCAVRVFQNQQSIVGTRESQSMRDKLKRLIIFEFYDNLTQ